MLRRLVSLVCSPVILLVRIADHRAALTNLGQLDDRELADIGLTRQDLRDATGLGLGVDPTRMLAERAREREALAISARPRRDRRRPLMAAE